MTKKQALRLKAFLVQVISHPNLSNVEKMDKVEEFVDRLVCENG